jgi:hypothetical protein
MEMMKQISAQEYMEYKTFMIKGSTEIEKEVISFIYDNISYQIERFRDSHEKPSILRVEGRQEFSIKDAPNFLKIKEDITGRPILWKKIQTFSHSTWPPDLKQVLKDQAGLILPSLGKAASIIDSVDKISKTN